jgi:deoxycytidylate deaminase
MRYCEPTCEPDFQTLNVSGWEWRTDLPRDQWLLDLAYFVARNSVCREGGMGCIVVSPVTDEDPRILVKAINTSFQNAMRSDTHAEANAICWCARHGVSMAGTTMYITRMPCKPCFQLLASAGVRRVVAPEEKNVLYYQQLVKSASTMNVELCPIPDTPERQQRRDTLAAAHRDSNAIALLRERRKRGRQPDSEARSAALSKKSNIAPEVPETLASDAAAADTESKQVVDGSLKTAEL